MKLGGAIALLVIGLILGLEVVRFPAELNQYVDFDRLGWVLVICGVLGLILVLVTNYMSTQHKTTYVQQTRPERRDDQGQGRW